MQGAWRPSGTSRPGRILYRCEVRRSRALPGELADHTSTLYVREGALLRHLDPWIESFADPAWLAEGQPGDPVAGARYVGLRTQLGDRDRKIANIMSAIESGGDAKLLAEQLAKRSTEREALKVRLVAEARATALTSVHIESLVAELGGVTAVLLHATREEKPATYDTLGLRLVYDDRNRQVRATVDLSRIANRVGGPTSSLAPPPIEITARRVLAGDAQFTPELSSVPQRGS